MRCLRLNKLVMREVKEQKGEKKKVKKLVHNGKVHLAYPANLQALFSNT